MDLTSISAFAAVLVSLLAATFTFLNGRRKIQADSTLSLTESAFSISKELMEQLRGEIDGYRDQLRAMGSTLDLLIEKNKELISENERLLSVNRELLAANVRLTAENERLRDDIQRFVQRLAAAGLILEPETQDDGRAISSTNL